MQCIALQQLQYEGIWIITTLPTWTKHIITHRAAHVMICPHRARVGKYKTLIWSADTLWENWCQKWGKGGFLWFVFETHFDCSSSIFTRWLLVMESSIPQSLLTAWMWRPHTFSFGFFLSFRCFLRNLPGHFANFVRVGLFWDFETGLFVFGRLWDWVAKLIHSSGGAAVEKGVLVGILSPPRSSLNLLLRPKRQPKSRYSEIGLPTFLPSGLKISQILGYDQWFTICW